MGTLKNISTHYLVRCWYLTDFPGSQDTTQGLFIGAGEYAQTEYRRRPSQKLLCSFGIPYIGELQARSYQLSPARQVFLEGEPLPLVQTPPLDNPGKSGWCVWGMRPLFFISGSRIRNEQITKNLFRLFWFLASWEKLFISFLVLFYT